MWVCVSVLKRKTREAVCKPWWCIFFIFHSMLKWNMSIFNFLFVQMESLQVCSGFKAGVLQSHLRLLQLHFNTWVSWELKVDPPLVCWNDNKGSSEYQKGRMELLYTSFLTQDWVKPALIYLRNKTFKKKIKKSWKYTNLCEEKPVHTWALWRVVQKTTTRGRHATHRHWWMSAVFFHSLVF